MKQSLTLIVILVAILGVIYIFDRQNPSSQSINSNSEMLDNGSQIPIISQQVSYHENANGYYVEPSGEGDYPGVVMVHEWWGLNENIKNTAEQLAREGYRVLAVDLYNGSVATTTEQAQQLRMAVTKEDSVANLQSAADYLRSQGSSRIASLGWCFGGGKSLELALSGEDLDATVIYYGQLETDPVALSAINWPVLGIFGEEDTSIPVASVEQFKEGLNANSIDNQIYIYPGVGHAFANPSGNNYAPEETSDAWAKTLVFLETYLKN